MMTIFLVDCENVGYMKLKNVKPDDYVFYFTSDRTLLFKLDSNETEIRFKHDGCKDALDFVLDSYLGFLIHKYGQSYVYNVVSRDLGYVNVCKFWQNRGYLVGCSCKKFPFVDWSKISNNDKEKIQNVYKNWCRSKKQLKRVLRSGINRLHIDMEFTERDKLVTYLMIYGVSDVS